MNYLIVTATAKEIDPFLRNYRNSGNPGDIDILITGVGLTAATYALTRQLTIRRPGVIIQAGVAGCFNQNIPLGSVVVVGKDTIADMGVMENKKLKTMFDLGLIEPNRFPFTKGWLINPHTELIKRTKLKAISSVSVNHVTTGKQMTLFYHDKFRPTTESMEGAALHYVGLVEKIPYVQIRSISNYIGERNKKNWKMTEAIGNLNKELARIINEFETLPLKPLTFTR